MIRKRARPNKSGFLYCIPQLGHLWAHSPHGNNGAEHQQQKNSKNRIRATTQKNTAFSAPQRG